MTLVRNVVKKNFHRDSVKLLRLSEEARKIEGIKDAAIVMGTSTNKEILTKLSLLTEEGKAASENDMVLAVMADSEAEIERGLRKVEELILKPPEEKGQRYYSVDAALQAVPDANLAIVSIPGEYAKPIVQKFLDRGVSVHLFSDHVPPEDELELKQLATSKGLLVMGPGAGTSLIGGKAIAFANVVKKGRIGIVAAAGTGLQEISVLLSEAGVGVSEGLGTGGGDVKAKVGGLMMLHSIDAFEKDSGTDIVVVVSKPPDPYIKRLMIEHIAKKTQKRYVTCFLGAENYEIPRETRSRVKGTKTLHAAFAEALESANPIHAKEIMKQFALSQSELSRLTQDISKGLGKNQCYVRGLYTGGTLAYESLNILGRLIGDVYSNAPLDPAMKLRDSYKSLKDSVVDLGEEEFTVGRAHPMIDPTIRRMRLVEEARDPEAAVILMDIMLGYGSHHDPAGAMLGAIKEANEIAQGDGRALPMLAHVCGTEQDPQVLSDQEAKLQKAGVHVFRTNSMMAIAGAMVAKRETLKGDAVEDVYTHFLTAF